MTAVAHLRLGRTSLFTRPGGEYELRFVKTLSRWRTGNWIFDSTFGCSGKTNELETLVNVE